MNKLLPILTIAAARSLACPVLLLQGNQDDAR